MSEASFWMQNHDICQVDSAGTRTRNFSIVRKLLPSVFNRESPAVATRLQQHSIFIRILLLRLSCAYQMILQYIQIQICHLVYGNDIDTLTGVEPMTSDKCYERISYITDIRLITILHYFEIYEKTKNLE